jgi:hypothetical protein
MWTQLIYMTFKFITAVSFQITPLWGLGVYEKGNENYELGTGSFLHKRIMSAV